MLATDTVQVDEKIVMIVIIVIFLGVRAAFCLSE
jgi:hypothetical protein